MLEPILKGLVQWIYEMMLDIMAYASGELLGVMSMDLHYFEQTAPIISDIVNIIIALGWALLLGNMVFQLTKSIVSGIGFEGEDPKMIFFRTFVFSFLLLASRQICEIGLSITGMVIDMLGLPDSITVTAPDEGMFSLGAGAKWLLVIIVGVILMVQMVKLLFEIGERYVIMSVLTFFAPLAFSMGGSRNTNDIFKGWCRMYGSMMVMMIMNIVFLKLIMSAMSQMASGNVLIWLVFVVALTRVARKIDSHIGKIGLNPAQTGDAISGRFPGAMTMMAVRVMTSAIGKSIAANKNTSSSGNRSGERRYAAGRADGRGRAYAGNRYSGGTSGADAYTNSTNSNFTGDSQTSSTASYHNSGSGQTAQNMYTQNQTGGFAGSQTRQAGVSPFGAPTTGANAQQPQNMRYSQNPEANSTERTAMIGSVQNVNCKNQENMGGAQPTNHPPLDRKTGTGKGSLPRPGVFLASKPGGGTQNTNIHGEHSIKGKKAAPGANPQFRVGRGVNGTDIILGSLSGKETPQGSAAPDGKTVSGNSPVTISSRTDGKKTVNQSGSTNVQNRNQTNRGGVTGRDRVQSVEKASSEHTENNRGMRETFSKEREHERFAENQSHHAMYQQRQDRELRREEHREKRVNHAYKHGRFNPSAENRKTRQSFYQKQDKGRLAGRKEGREIRRNSDRKWGEDNRKRKWEK